MKFVFGPVPSKRLGQSLGIDTIPLKTCNWNCVYCQLGRTVPLTNKRLEYYPRKEILQEVNQTLQASNNGDIDWITFVGSGEPTLHSGIGWLIRKVKEISSLPVAVITNGSLLHLSQVREELLPADAVLPSLDAGSARSFRRINRPHGRLSFKRHVEGLIAFSQEYRGKLWVEVMLVKGLNDTQEALHELGGVLEQIEPDEIHINSPTRPPVETWVQPVDQRAFERAREILGKNVRVVASADGAYQLNAGETLDEAIVGIITRHPISEEELIQTLEKYPQDVVKDTLDMMKESGRVQVVNRQGINFWSGAPAKFPTEIQSQATSPERLDSHIRKVNEN